MKGLFTADAFSVPQSCGTSTFCSQIQEATEVHLDITGHKWRPAASWNSYCLSWMYTNAVKTQNLLNFLVESRCN